MANLEIQVGADIKDAVNGFKQLETQTGASMGKVASDVKGAAAKMATASAQMGGSVAKGANQANVAMVNLGRVLQDSPYGFIGISNNLNPLLESFQRLKAETGTTGAAIKALAGSLLGGGGLGLALSLVTSVLSFTSLGLGMWTRGMNSSKKETDDQINKINELKQALENYVNVLNVVDQARIKGSQSAQDELTKLKTLYAATQNANIPLAERKKLVDQLQEQYPKYFKNISDETILAGGATKAYNSLADAILAAGKARAGQDAIIALAKQELVLEDQKANALKDQEAAYNKLREAKNNANKPSDQGIVTGGGITGATSGGFNKDQRQVDITIAQDVYNSKLRETNKIQGLINDNLDKQRKLAQSVQTTIQQNPESLLDPTGNLTDTHKVKDENKKITDILEERKKILLEFVKDFETIKVKFPDLSKRLEDFKINELTKELRFKLANALTGLTPNIGTVQGIDPKKVPIPLQPIITWKDTDLHKQIVAFNDQLNSAFLNFRLSGFENIGQGIADAINGAGLENSFKRIGDVMGTFIQEIGKLLIKEGIAAKAFKDAFSKLIANPALAIGVGIGLVALGGIIKNAILPKPKGFAQGGLVYGPVNALVGEGIGTTRNNPEVIAPLDRLQRMLGGSALGGQQVIIPDVKIRGNDLVLVFNRASQSQQRNFGRGGF